MLKIDAKNKFELAQKNFENKAYIEAQKIWLEIHNYYPKNLQVLRNLSLAFYYNKDLEDAEKILKKIININEKEPNALVMLILILEDQDKLDEIGLEPIKDIVSQAGGWPVVEGDAWKGEKFDVWKQSVKVYHMGYSSNYIATVDVATDAKNNSHRVLHFDQPQFGLSKDYWNKGLEEPEVKAYFTFMVETAILFGADEARAKELETQIEALNKANSAIDEKLAQHTTLEKELKDLKAAKKAYKKVKSSETASKDDIKAAKKMYKKIKAASTASPLKTSKEDDASVAASSTTASTTGGMADGIVRICYAFKKDGTCLKGDLCEFAHINNVKKKKRKTDVADLTDTNNGATKLSKKERNKKAAVIRARGFNRS